MDIKFKFEALDGLATRLDRAAARGRFALAAVDAVNLVTKRADETLRRGETAGINLSPAYVKSKTDVALASGGGKARATITTKGDLTVMSNFGVTMASMRRTGGTLRAGPRAGCRNAGTNFTIKRGSPQFEPQWFVLPLKGAGGVGGMNGFGVFMRRSGLTPGKDETRPGKFGKQHIYGPSPYALFKEQIRLQQDDIRADLERTALQRMGDALEDAFA